MNRWIISYFIILFCIAQPLRLLAASDDAVLKQIKEGTLEDAITILPELNRFVDTAFQRPNVDGSTFGYINNIAIINHLDGDTQRAVEILDRLHPGKIKCKLNRIDSVIYYLNSFDMNLYSGNFQEAISLLLDLQSLSKGKDFDPFLSIGRAHLWNLFEEKEWLKSEIVLLDDYLESSKMSQLGIEAFNIHVNRLMIEADLPAFRNHVFESSDNYFSKVLEIQKAEFNFHRGLSYDVTSLKALQIQSKQLELYRKKVLLKYALADQQAKNLESAIFEVLRLADTTGAALTMIEVCDFLDVTLQERMENSILNNISDYLHLRDSIKAKKEKQFTSFETLLTAQKISVIKRQSNASEFIQANWVLFVLTFFALLGIVWVLKKQQNKSFNKREEIQRTLNNLTKNDLLNIKNLLENYSLKESASKMNVSISAVEKARFRLKKKLSIDPSLNLRAYLLELDSKGFFDSLD